MHPIIETSSGRPLKFETKLLTTLVKIFSPNGVKRPEISHMMGNKDPFTGLTSGFRQTPQSWEQIRDECQANAASVGGHSSVGITD